MFSSSGKLSVLKHEGSIPILVLHGRAFCRDQLMVLSQIRKLAIEAEGGSEVVGRHRLETDTEVLIRQQLVLSS